MRSPRETPPPPTRPPILYSLLDLLHSLRPVFTEPTFIRFVALFAGWVQTHGLHAVTESLVQTGISGKQHHAAFHRVFSRASWCVDSLGRLLIVRLCKICPGAFLLVLDDTLATHKGPKVFGLGAHLDPVRSTRLMHQFSFGHVWVTLAVLVRVPFTDRAWAVPVLFRLYRTEADCKARGVPHRKKTELARELLDLVASWVQDREIEVVADQAYSNDTLLRGLPERITFIGAMRDDAVLSRPRKRKTRSSRTGRVLTKDLPVPKPGQIARSTLIPWQKISARIYGQEQVVQYKELVACWYRAAGKRMLKIVIVKMTSGRIPFRVFFSTNTSRSAREIIESYSCRWAIELMFRNLKQLLGFSHSRARTKLAVLRTAPWVGLSYTLLVLWYMERAVALNDIGLPARPWYRRKRAVSFEDILRLAQTTLATVDWSDPRRVLANLRIPDPQAPAVANTA